MEGQLAEVKCAVMGSRFRWTWIREGGRRCSRARARYVSELCMARGHQVGGMIHKVSLTDGWSVLHRVWVEWRRI